MNYLEKRKLFIVWNAARKKAKQQPDSVEQILDRLNKALGILQHHDYYQAEKELYKPTFASCGCPDWQYRNSSKRKYTGPCKHMAALILEARVKALKYEQKTFLDLLEDASVPSTGKAVEFTGKVWMKGIENG